MAIDVGFVLITHRSPEQVVRLVRRLNELYGSPPIVCHHDFLQCDLPLAALPKNVSFVRPHLRTSWGGFAVVEGTVRAIRQLFQRTDAPDWFVLLSGTDYPIKPAASVIRDLGDARYDAHIFFQPIDPAALESDWQRECYRRYFTSRIYLPDCSRESGFGWKSRRLPRWMKFPRHPFREGFRCYAGSQWFAANRDAAACVLREAERRARFNSYCCKAPFTEELYFQTLLVNVGGMRLNNVNYRYTDWSAGGSHPKTLGMEDLPALLGSSSHFARKFCADRPAVLDAIDRAVDEMARMERRGGGAQGSGEEEGQSQRHLLDPGAVQRAARLRCAG